MSKVTAQRTSVRRRRVSIEVYFVLYLCAVTLLLGTTKKPALYTQSELEQAILQLVGHDFQVQAEKVALIYTVIPASMPLDSSINVSRDSVNIIRALGNVTDLEFHIAGVRDTLSGKTLPAESAILEGQGDRSVLFRWKPGIEKQSGVYQVTIAASALPVLPANLSSSAREKVEGILRSGGRLTDSVRFTVNLISVGDAASLNRAVAATNAAQDTSEHVSSSAPLPLSLSSIGQAAQSISLLPREPTIRAAAGTRWQTHIGVMGPTVLLSGVRYEISPPGSARIVAQQANGLDLEGTAPTTGQQHITVAARAANGSSAMAFFDVSSAALSDPSLPPSLFAGQTLRLDFTSPGAVEAKDIALEIIENGRVTVPRSSGPPVQNYIVPDSGSVLFVRYVAGRELGRYRLQIQPLPLPAITTEPQKTPGGVFIKTVSYGDWKGVKNVSQLKIADGNANDPERVSIQDIPNSSEHIETWLVRPRSAGRFSFRAYVIDQRGSHDGKSKTLAFDVP